VVQFYQPGKGNRVGIVQADKVIDATDIAGENSTSLLLRYRESRDALSIVGKTAASLRELDVDPSQAQAHLRVPVDPSEVWGAGVTYKRSAEFYEGDSTSGRGIYDMAYSATRPELFYKGRAVHCVGPNAVAGIRSDSVLTAPEPEVALVLSGRGEVLGCTLCDDISARDIERENPLYLSQSKVFYGCTVLGPTVVTPGEIGDIRNLTLSCIIRRAKKVVFQESVGLDRLKRSFKELVSYLTLNNPIQDGTMLTTGTGIIVPPEFALCDDDVVEITCEPIGILRHSVRRLPPA
jgi:2-dehydro-3-deoxy-D-arabinonate dehydratase